MKKRVKPFRQALTVVFLVLASPHWLNAQSVDLFITYIRGGAVKEKGKKALQEGQVINSAEKLRFIGEKDFLIAISTAGNKARYKISRLPGENEVKGSESWDQVALMMHLLWETPNLVSRSDEFPTLEIEFRADSAINRKMLFTTVNKYLFNFGSYPIDADHFFFLQLQHEGRAESQPLATNKDTLLISFDSFNAVQGRMGGDEGSYYLGYFDKTNNRAKRIAAFDPVFDKDGALNRLVQATGQALGVEAGRKEIFNESYSEAYHFIGKPSMITLMEKVVQLLPRASK